MPQMKRLEGPLNILLKTGVLERVRYLMPGALTILNYHRVTEFKDVSTFKPNISADAVSFDQQMKYLSRNYHVISYDHLAAWLRGAAVLKPHSAMITFDDGYYDNFSVAYPILRKYGLPAIIFLATNYIGGNTPFLWDYAARCFFLTEKASAQLPVIGFASWESGAVRDHVLNRWVNRVKRLPNDERSEAMKGLSDALDVTIPIGAFDGLYLNWNHVRELVKNGIEMGAHTASHPIMTSISLRSAREELELSRKKIESETGLPVRSFAYPNGQSADFSVDIVNIVKELGFETAFTLLAGPASRRSVRENPHTIQRIFIGNSDTFSRFVAKLSGFEAISQIQSGWTKQ